MCNNVLKRVARTYVTIPAIQCLKFSLFCTLFFLNLLQMFEENSKSHIQRPHYKRGNLALGQLQETVRHCTRTQILVRTAGHILRLPDHRAAKVAISWTPADGRHKTGRPRRRAAELSSRICRWSISSGWICCNWPFKMAPSCRPMCPKAREELSSSLRPSAWWIKMNIKYANWCTPFSW